MAPRYMSVEIGIEAAQFYFWEYCIYFEFFGIVLLPVFDIINIAIVVMSSITATSNVAVINEVS
jgi:hypothetical protein